MNDAYDKDQNDDNTQAALWNGSAGRAWVDSQALMDTMFRPIEDLLLESLADVPNATVLDVGCGAGATTLAIARRLGAQGGATGIDISAPMIAAAREGAARAAAAADFICADAQRHDFGPARFDLVLSRFGVMFFDDPVAAFARLRRAARDHGRLRFVAWRSPAENPFQTAAERAAKPLLPQLPDRRPDDPGQFGFASRERVADILAAAGWQDIKLRAADIPCAFPASELPAYLKRMGPVGRALESADAATRDKVIAALQPAFAPYVQSNEVRFTAACWDVSARVLPT